MPGTNDSETIRFDGNEIEIEHRGPEGSGARIDVEHQDGRKWRVIVSRSGELQEIETRYRTDR
jgi:hypothetical protein